MEIDISDFETKTNAFNIEEVRKKTIKGAERKIKEKIFSAIEKIERSANWGINFIILSQDEDNVSTREFLRAKGFKLSPNLVDNGTRVEW